MSYFLKKEIACKRKGCSSSNLCENCEKDIEDAEVAFDIISTHGRTLNVLYKLVKIRNKRNSESYFEVDLSMHQKPPRKGDWLVAKWWPEPRIAGRVVDVKDDSVRIERITSIGKHTDLYYSDKTNFPPFSGARFRRANEEEIERGRKALKKHKETKNEQT